MSCDIAAAERQVKATYEFLRRGIRIDVQCPIVSMIVGKNADKEPSAQLRPK